MAEYSLRARACPARWYLVATVANQPTIQPGDYVFGFEGYYASHAVTRGDFVAFLPPGAALAGSELPILILTARDTLAMKVEALDRGADDFMLKPFEQEELAARCRALIRRSNLRANGQLNLGRVRIDVSGRQLRIDHEPVELTGREWLVLECLALNSGRVVSKERLQQAIASWDQALTPNAVEVYVSRVRAKLGDAALIRTVRGLGYRLDEPRV